MESGNIGHQVARLNRVASSSVVGDIHSPQLFLAAGIAQIEKGSSVWRKCRTMFARFCSVGYAARHGISRAQIQQKQPRAALIAFGIGLGHLISRPFSVRRNGR